MIRLIPVYNPKPNPIVFGKKQEKEPVDNAEKKNARQKTSNCSRP